MTRARRFDVLLGRTAIWCAVLAALSVVVLDVFVGLPRTGAGSIISAYVYTPGAWLFRFAMVLLMLGTVAMLVALVRQDRTQPVSMVTVLLAISVVALAAVAVFPKTDWSVGDTLTGQLHRLGSVVAVVAPPAAILRVTRQQRARSGGLPRTARAARWSALAVVGILVGFVAFAFSVASKGRAWWLEFPLGTLERSVVGCELVAMALLGMWIVATAADQATPGDPQVDALTLSVDSVTQPAPAP